MKLYIIRHGETQWNAQKRLQGASDTELNEKGIALAKATGEALKKVPFDCCFTSPLKRARDTARLILGNRQAPVYEDARIREISFGEWEGQESALLPSVMLDNFFHHTELYQAPKGGESLQQLCARTREFWEELVRRGDLQEKTILIASHGCAVRGILQNVYKAPSIKKFWHGCVPPNCSVNLVEIKDGMAVLLKEDAVYGHSVDMREG